MFPALDSTELATFILAVGMAFTSPAAADGS